MKKLAILDKLRKKQRARKACGGEEKSSFFCQLQEQPKKVGCLPDTQFYFQVLETFKHSGILSSCNRMPLFRHGFIKPQNRPQLWQSLYLPRGDKIYLTLKTFNTCVLTISPL